MQFAGKWNLCSRVSYITTMASGKLWYMITRDRKVALLLSERLPNEKKQFCILLSYTYDTDHSRCVLALC